MESETNSVYSENCRCDELKYIRLSTPHSGPPNTARKDLSMGIVSSLLTPVLGLVGGLLVGLGGVVAVLGSIL